MLLLSLDLTAVLDTIDYDLMIHHLTDMGLWGVSLTVADPLSSWLGTEGGAWGGGFSMFMLPFGMLYSSEDNFLPNVV